MILKKQVFVREYVDRALELQLGKFLLGRSGTKLVFTS